MVPLSVACQKTWATISKLCWQFLRGLGWKLIEIISLEKFKAFRFFFNSVFGGRQAVISHCIYKWWQMWFIFEFRPCDDICLLLIQLLILFSYSWNFDFFRKYSRDFFFQIFLLFIRSDKWQIFFGLEKGLHANWTKLPKRFRFEIFKRSWEQRIFCDVKIRTSYK